MLIVEIEVEFEHMNYDDNVELVRNSQNNRTQQVKYTVLFSNLKVRQHTTRVVSYPQNEYDRRLQQVLHHTRSTVRQQLKLFVLDLTTLLNLVLKLHKSSLVLCLALLLMQLLVTLQHSLQKQVLQGLIRLEALYLLEVCLSILFLNLFLEQLDIIHIILNQYLLIIITLRILLLTLPLMLLLLIIQQIYIKTMQLLILLLHKFSYLLLNQTQIHSLNRRYTHVHQVTQHKVVQVNRTHRRQISQHTHRQLHRNRRQHVLVKRVQHLLQHHLSHLHHRYYQPNVSVEHRRVSEVEVTRRTQSYQVHPEQKFTTVPLKRLEFLTQDLVLLVLFTTTVLAHQQRRQMVSQIHRNHYVTQTHPARPQTGQCCISHDTYVIVYKIVPH